MMVAFPITFMGGGEEITVQPFTITIAAGATTGTATIDEVDTNTTAVFWNGILTNSQDDSDEQNKVFSRIELTNATTVTATRDTASDDYTVTVRGTVVDFTSSIVESVQRGIIAITTSTTTGTATIDSVDTERSVVLNLGASNDWSSGSSSGFSMTVMALTNATTVTMSRASSSTVDTTGSYEVVQFKEGVIESIQQASGTPANFQAQANSTIDEVDMENTMIIYRGLTSTASAMESTFTRLSLTTETNVNYTRNSVSSTNPVNHCTVLEFVEGILSVQRGSTACAGTSDTATITEVDSSKSFISMTGFTTANTAEQWDNVFPTVALTDATTVTVNKDAADTSSTANWEVITFT